MANCTSCGAAIKEGVAFCTECGAKAPDSAPASAPIPQSAPPAYQSAPQSAPQPSYQPRRQSAFEETPSYSRRERLQPQPPTGKYAVVGTGSFFGLIFLFAIPVIGWLACLITAFASGSANKRSFARAQLIWILIGIALAVGAYFLFKSLGSTLLAYVNELTGGEFTNISELIAQLKEYAAGGITLPTA